MTKFLQKSFTVGGSSSDAYRENYEKIFRKNPDVNPCEPFPDPLSRNTRWVTIALSVEDFDALHAWGVDPLPGKPLDPEVAHAVLMAAADAAAAAR